MIAFNLRVEMVCSHLFIYLLTHFLRKEKTTTIKPKPNLLDLCQFNLIYILTLFFVVVVVLHCMLCFNLFNFHLKSIFDIRVHIVIITSQIFKVLAVVSMHILLTINSRSFFLKVYIYWYKQILIQNYV